MTHEVRFETVEVTHTSTDGGDHVLTSTDAAIADWLARAHELPAAAKTEWTDHRIAMLPLGRRFDAVRIHPRLVHAAAESAETYEVDGFLADLLHGPVIYDPGSWYYALVPPRTTENWSSPLGQCLGRGAWLGVPRTDRVTPRGDYWAVPMEVVGRLCSPDVVGELVSLGHERLTAAS